MKTLCIILSLLIGHTFNSMQSLNDIYKIIDKADEGQILTENEMYMLLNSYKTDVNNVELSECRAFGIASIAQNRKNSKTLIHVLKKNPHLFNEKICVDMAFSEEIEEVIDNLKGIRGYRDKRFKIWDKLQLLR